MLVPRRARDDAIATTCPSRGATDDDDDVDVATTRVGRAPPYNPEVEILQRVDHPNVVRFFEMAEDTSTYYIVMEMVNGGELFDRVIEREVSNDVAQKDLAS